MTVDGLGFEEVNQSVTSTAMISGTNIFAAGSLTAGVVVGTNISATTYSNIRAGLFLTSAGSSVSVAFSPAFAAAPTVVTCGFAATADDVWVKGVSAGSVQFYSTTASVSGAYIAFG